MVKLTENSRSSKKLYRSSKDKFLGGVCAGLGEYFDIDSNIVRIVWVALTLASPGFGILLYIAAWLLVPMGPENAK